MTIEWTEKIRSKCGRKEGRRRRYERIQKRKKGEEELKNAIFFN
jgi:hypothetical protein